jgi:hypothetical protein
MFPDMAIETVSVACVFPGKSIMLNFATARRHDARIKRLEAEIDRLLARGRTAQHNYVIESLTQFQTTLDGGDPGILICDVL